MPKQPPPEPSTSLSLDDLQKKLGTPAEVFVNAIVDEDTREEFIALGTQIASRHILSDAPRIYGLAYALLSTATSAQREMLDVSQNLIAVGVHLASKLRKLIAGSRKVGVSSLVRRMRWDASLMAGLRLGCVGPQWVA